MSTNDKKDIYFNDLPDPLKLKIFSYLSNHHLGVAARVCSSWRELAYDCSLWQVVDLRRYRSYLREPDIIRVVKNRCAPMIRKLNLGGYTLSPRIFRLFVSDCPVLQTLSLESCIFVNDFAKLSDMFPASLRNLDIRYSSGDESAFTKLADNLQNVHCFGLSDEFFDRLEAIEEIPNLFVNMANLRLLEFSYCTAMRDESVRLIAHGCKHLKSLCLRRCHNIAGSTLGVLIEKAEFLTSLVVDGTSLNDDSLIAVPWKKSKITELDASWCRFITPRGLDATLPHLPHLKYLRLCCCGYGHAINDAILRRMAAGGCKALEIVDVSYSTDISDNGLGQFAGQCPKLSYLRVNHCRNISQHLMSFLRQGPHPFIVGNFTAIRLDLMSGTICTPAPMRNDDAFVLPFSMYWPSPPGLRRFSLDFQMGQW